MGNYVLRTAEEFLADGEAQTAQREQDFRAQLAEFRAALDALAESAYAIVNVHEPDIAELAWRNQVQDQIVLIEAAYQLLKYGKVTPRVRREAKKLVDEMRVR